MISQNTDIRKSWILLCSAEIFMWIFSLLQNQQGLSCSSSVQWWYLISSVILILFGTVVVVPSDLVLPSPVPFLVEGRLGFPGLWWLHLSFFSTSRSGLLKDVQWWLMVTITEMIICFYFICFMVLLTFLLSLLLTSFLYH